MGAKFQVRNGQLLQKQKSGEKLDMVEPPATPYKSCRKNGHGTPPLVRGMSPIRVMESWHRLGSRGGANGRKRPNG